MRGRIYVQPTRRLRLLEVSRQRVRDEKALCERLSALRDTPSETSDGVRLPLYANIGLLSDMPPPCATVPGVGRYRTEYPFLLREAFPTEDEHWTARPPDTLRLSGDLRPVFAAGLVHAAPELVRYMNFDCRRHGLDLRMFAASDSATRPELEPGELQSGFEAKRC